jgi:hypothetical protein
MLDQKIFKSSLQSPFKMVVGPNRHRKQWLGCYSAQHLLLQ